MNSTQKIFSVTLVNPNSNQEKTIYVEENQLILDKTKGEIPYCCSAGACTICTSKLLEGTVEQTAQAIQFLGHALVDAGYILPCAAYATSNCQILTHQEEEIF
ncbi:MAG: 2Fe-2S iron-sulfur cluster-binding protein [Crocosphaera sp.]